MENIRNPKSSLTHRSTLDLWVYVVMLTTFLQLATFTNGQSQFPTYNHPSYEGQLCYQCPPGYFKEEDCKYSSTKLTQWPVCVECPEKQFSQRWNTDGRCWDRLFCEESHVIIYDGGSTGPVKCSCKSSMVEVDGRCVEAVTLKNYTNSMAQARSDCDKRVKAAMVTATQRPCPTQQPRTMPIQETGPNCSEAGVVIAKAVVAGVGAAAVILLAALIWFIHKKHSKSTLDANGGSRTARMQGAEQNDGTLAVHGSEPFDPSSDSSNLISVSPNPTSVPSNLTSLPPNPPSVPSNLTSVSSNLTSVPPNPASVCSNFASIPPNPAPVPPNSTSMPPNLTSVLPNLASVLYNSASIPPNPASVSPNLTSLLPNLASVLYNSASIPPKPASLPPDLTSVPPNSASVPFNAASIPPNPTSVPPNSASGPISPASVSSNSAFIPPRSYSGPPTLTSVPLNPVSVSSNSPSIPPNAASVPPNPASVPPNSASVPPNSASASLNLTSVPSNPASVPPNSISESPNLISVPPNPSCVPPNLASRSPNLASVPSNPASGSPELAFGQPDPLDEASRIVERELFRLSEVDAFMRHVLNFPANLCDRVTNEKKEAAFQIRQAFKYWQRQAGSDASVENLVASLQDNEWLDLAEKVSSKLDVFLRRVPKQFQDSEEGLFDKACRICEGTMRSENDKEFLRSYLGVTVKDGDNSFMRAGLSSWQKQRGSAATARELVRLLYEGGIAEVADEICNKLKIEKPDQESENVNEETRLSQKEPSEQNGGAPESEVERGKECDKDEDSIEYEEIGYADDSPDHGGKAVSEDRELEGDKELHKTELCGTSDTKHLEKEPLLVSHDEISKNRDLIKVAKKKKRK